jgi:hypothetical protein
MVSQATRQAAKLPGYQQTLSDKVESLRGRIYRRADLGHISAHPGCGCWFWLGNVAADGSIVHFLGAACRTSYRASGLWPSRGIILGNPKLHVARSGAVQAVKAEADRYAANVLPIIREAQTAGATTLREIANALNARGVATARGGGAMARQVRQQHP